MIGHNIKITSTGNHELAAEYLVALATWSRCMIFEALSHGPATPERLCDGMLMDPISLHQHMRELTLTGFVEFLRPGGDSRYGLTAKGRQALTIIRMTQMDPREAQ